MLVLSNNIYEYLCRNQTILSPVFKYSLMIYEVKHYFNFLEVSWMQVIWGGSQNINQIFFLIGKVGGTTVNASSFSGN